MVSTLLLQLSSRRVTNAASGAGAQRRRSTPLAGEKPVGLLLFGDDLILDLLVGGLGDDLLLDQLVLALVGPSVDDLLRVGVAHARKRLQLVHGGGVDVEKLLLH